MQTLDVVNECLGTMGETPLNTLSEPHEFKSAALQFLKKFSATCQAKGWWFNRETLTLPVDARTGKIYIPGDALSVRTTDKAIVARGRVLYDTSRGTNVFTSAEDVVIIRQVPFDELPESVAAYIAAQTVHRFQSLYDGDSTKTRELSLQVAQTLMEANTEEIRNVGANMVAASTRLQYIKHKTQRGRWTRRPL